MILRAEQTGHSQVSIPRESGDDPLSSCPGRVVPMYSPRERG